MESDHPTESHLRAEAPEFHPNSEDMQSDWMDDDDGTEQQPCQGEEVDAALEDEPEGVGSREKSQQTAPSGQEEADTSRH